MTRTIYWSYESADLTKYLNNCNRGILNSGIYKGFNAVPGSSGMKVTLQMETDPDNPTGKLGKLLSRDGAVIEETTDVIDAVQADPGDGTYPRTDYVVATYVYNASTPPNDVTYSVLKGTAGSPPIPPTISDNQVLIAELRIPAGTATILSTHIFNVTHNSIGSPEKTTYDEVIRPGVYSGYVLSDGTSNSKISLSAGVAVTNEYVRIKESGSLLDKFTVGTLSSNLNVRYDVIVALHKYDGTQSNSPEYLLVQGTEQDKTASTAATLPSDAVIIAAATAYNPKYTSLTYITKIGYICVTSDTLPTLIKEYHHYPKMLHNQVWYVSDGKVSKTSLMLHGDVSQYWPLTGYEGLVSALSVARTIVTEYYSASDPHFLEGGRIKILVDGDFFIPSVIALGIPSFVELEGVGQAVIRQKYSSSYGLSIILGGHSDVALSSPTITDSGVSQVGVPVGYRRVEILATPNAASGYLSYPLGYKTANFAGNVLAGDPITVVINSAVGTGWFETYTTTVIPANVFAFRAIIPTSLGLVNFTQLVMKKQYNAVRNINVILEGSLGATVAGAILTKACSRSTLDNITAAAWSTDCFCTDCYWRSILINHYGIAYSILASPAPSITYRGYNNRYGSVIVKPDQAGASTSISYSAAGYHRGEYNSLIEIFDYDGGSSNYGVVNIEVDRGSIININMRHTSGDCKLLGFDADIENVTMNDASESTKKNLMLDGINSLYNKITVQGGANQGDISIQAGAQNNVIGVYTANALLDLSSLKKNYVVSTACNDVDEDRNIKIVSDATISWDLPTGVLTWNDRIYLDLPYNSGRLYVSAGSSILSDGDRLVLTLDRGVLVDTAVTVSVVARTSMYTYRSPNTFILARRSGSSIYFYDGSRLENGIPGTLGHTTEFISPLGSYATYFFEPIDNSAYRNKIVYTNTGLSTFTYVSSTGWVTYTNYFDMTQVRVGDVFLDSTGNRYPIKEVQWLNRRLLLSKGLTVSTTVAMEYDGAVVRGNVVVKNSSLRTITYTITTGVLQYSGPIDLSHVSTGYLFVDGAGNKFRIISVNAGAYNVTLFSGLTVNTSVTTQDHGSIETNDNPRNINLSDCRSQVGVESLLLIDPFFDRGRVDTYDNIKSPSVLEPPGYYRESPDKRIAYGISSLSTIQSNYESNYCITSNYINSTRAASFIEVTAYMTGMSVETTDSTVPTITIDGKAVTAVTGHLPVGVSTDRPFYPVNAQVGARDLSPGIHTVRIFTASKKYYRVFIYNDPLYGSSMLDVGGSLLYNGKRYDYVDEACVSIPTVGLRGGRVLRYAPFSDLTTRDFAVRSLREFITSGNMNTPVNTTLVTVISTSGLNVGDLILVERTTPSIVREILCIQSLTSNSITLTSVPVGFSAGDAVDIYYRGISALTAYPSYMHSSEVVDNVYTMADFIDYDSGGGSLDPYTPWISSSNYDKGADAWDGVTYVSGNSCRFFSGGTESLTPVPYDRSSFVMAVGSRMKFGFVGVGMDILRDATYTSTLTVDVYVDGALTASGLSILDSTWTSLCADLSYGFHMVELLHTSGGELLINKFRSYRQKDPYISGIPISGFNKLGTFRQIDKANCPSEGVIQYSVEDKLGAGATTAFRVSPTLTYSIRRGNRNLYAAAAGTYINIPFYGSSISLILRGSGALGVISTITFLDKDGTYKSPASLTGISVTPNGATIGLPTTPATWVKYTWILSEVGFNCIRLNGFTNSDIMGIETSQPFFIHKRYKSGPISYGRSGTWDTCDDLRYIDPISKGLIVAGGSVSLPDQSLTGGGGTIVELVVPVAVNSSGGVYNVTVDCNASYTGFVVGMSLKLSHNLAAEYLYIPQTSNNRPISCTYSKLVYLQKGLNHMHIYITRATTAQTLTVSNLSLTWTPAMLMEESNYENYKSLAVQSSPL